VVGCVVLTALTLTESAVGATRERFDCRLVSGVGYQTVTVYYKPYEASIPKTKGFGMTIDEVTVVNLAVDDAVYRGSQSGAIGLVGDMQKGAYQHFVRAEFQYRRFSDGAGVLTDVLKITLDETTKSAGRVGVYSCHKVIEQRNEVDAL
jgi:hypothetical protein